MTQEPRQALEVTPMKLLPALGVAIAAVALATLARALLFRYLAANLPYLTFFPAVIAATLWGGSVAGLAATLFSALVSVAWLKPPAFPVPASPEDRLGMVLFIAICTFIVLAVRQVYQAQLRSSALAAERQKYADERQRLLESERAARSTAEHASFLKDEFLASLSHELRTPLNAILGWVQLLRSPGTTDDDVRRGMETIERNARAQARIIEDLLEMSRIVSGNLRLDLQRTDIAQLIETSIEALLPTATGKEIAIVKRISQDTCPVSGDAARLQQVIWNLLSNAIKFTPHGGRVEITLQRIESRIELTVHDNGVGIRPDFLPYVFDRFRRQDAATTRRHSGLGLGLSIVKNLVEMHGGSVSATSAGENKGATFTVTLPIAPLRSEEAVGTAQSQSASDACKSVDLSGVCVLAVDDEADARDLVRRFLVACKADVLLASSADEALRLAAEKRPHVLISDIGMPDKDGYELIRELRARDDEHGGRIPAVALTAFARSEDRTNAMLSGYQVHLSKPIQAPELLAAVANLTGRTG